MLYIKLFLYILFLSFKKRLIENKKERDMWTMFFTIVFYTVTCQNIGPDVIVFQLIFYDVELRFVVVVARV